MSGPLNGRTIPAAIGAIAVALLIYLGASIASNNNDISSLKTWREEHEKEDQYTRSDMGKIGESLNRISEAIAAQMQKISAIKEQVDLGRAERMKRQDSQEAEINTIRAEIAGIVSELKRAERSAAASPDLSR